MKNNGRINILEQKPTNKFNLFPKQMKSFPSSRCSNPNLGNTHKYLYQIVFFQKIFKFFKMRFDMKFGICPINNM